MQDIFTSIKAYLYERSVSPLIGAFLASWSAWNYRFYVILFSDGLSLPREKFKEIDMLFGSKLYSVGDVSILINGKLADGILMPAIIAFVYLYVYPLIAKPVYEHSLRKQKELRVIKQEQEDQRLLSVEESREIYRKLAQMQSKHQEEIDGYNNQISAQNQYIERLENSGRKNQEEKPEDTESDVGGLSEEELQVYERQIQIGIQTIDAGKFLLNELFGQKQWSEIPVPARQALGKRFRLQVERGDFVGISTLGKNTGNQQQYYKKP
jgi:hypothetical protein